jgi:hypothetical protein
MMVAVAVFSVGVIGFIGAYSGIARSTQNSKVKAIAANLAQEKIETIKNYSYTDIFASTAALTSTCMPSPGYDGGFFPIESITTGGINFQRGVMIRKVDASSGNYSYVNWDQPDTGLKEVLVSVSWTPAGSPCQLYQLRNLATDPNLTPLSASFSGTISSGVIGGTAVPGATIMALENTSFNAVSDSSGRYSFKVQPGNYTLQVSSSGWFTKVSATLSIGANGATTQNFALTQMSSGSVTGRAFVDNGIVISQVVIDTYTWCGDGNQHHVEYIELYNPTNNPIYIGATGEYYYTHNGHPPYSLWFEGASNGAYEYPLDGANWFNLQYTTTTVPAISYFLISNADRFLLNGVWVTADASYHPLYTQMMSANPGQAGYVAMGQYPSGPVTDMVGWDSLASGAGYNNSYWLPRLSTTTIPNYGANASWGSPAGNQIVRLSSQNASGFSMVNYGHAFNTGVATADWLYPNGSFSGIQYMPHNISSGAFTVVSGKPAGFAIATAGDGLSSPVSADSQGYFALTNVATGTWAVEADSGSYSQQSSSVTVAAKTTTNIGSLILNLPTTNGYISGRVTDGTNIPLNGISVTASGMSALTNANGYYFASVPAGTYTVNANPGNLNKNYVSLIEPNVVVALGIVTSGVDFSLANGGIFMGFVTYDGVNPYPGPAMNATLSGIPKGDGGAVGNDGYFTISNLPAGTYTVTPYGKNNEAFSPTTNSATASAGTTVFVGTYTVTNGYGTITGSVTSGGAAINTGVLVIASTGTIATANPPTLNAAARTASNVYYTGTSKSDGTYSISVPAATYNVYGWYTTYSGAGVPTSVKRSGSSAVTANHTATVNLAW